MEIETYGGQGTRRFTLSAMFSDEKTESLLDTGDRRRFSRFLQLIPFIRHDLPLQVP